MTDHAVKEEYPGHVPVLKIEGRTLPEAWEKSVLAAWEQGARVPTEYDKPGDPPSRDTTMIIVVHEPLAEPRIHRAFPAGLAELEVYRQEVLLGIHDHWIDPDAGKWTYTYHKRLCAYETEGQTIDQVAYMVDRLARDTCTRRANAITWNVALDPPTDDPPCLQRLWGRIITTEQGELVFNFNTHWRSRDAYKAAFMNMFAFTDLQRAMAAALSEKIGKQVAVGRYCDISDSFHIYGSYFSEFEGFLQLIEKRSFEDRTWNTEFAEPFFEEARQRIAAEGK
jgi:thymidylate synthase